MLVKIGGLISAVVGITLVWLKYFTDMVGRSTFWEDFLALTGRFEGLFEWLLGQPALIFYWVPLTALLVSVLFVFYPDISALISPDKAKSLGERMKRVGGQCLIMANDLNRRIEAKAMDSLEVQDRLWSEYLPIAVELEDLGLDTPDGCFESPTDFVTKERYLRFVGKLLKEQKLKVAKQTARNLSRDPNPPSAKSDILSQIGIVRKKPQ